MTFRQVLPLFALVSLVGCGLLNGRDGGGAGDAPVITSFSASPGTISTPGESVTLSWSVSGAVTGLEIDGGVGPVSGTRTVVNPTATTTYTLTARNSAGSDTATTRVTVADTTPPPPPPPTGDVTPPTGDFGVSSSPDGPFTSDQGSDIESPDDPRVVALEPGDTFYARVSYSDPSGIADIIVRLNNSSPPGLRADLVEGQEVGGFTLVGTVGACDLAARPTSVTCVYEISVADDVLNIDELPGAGSEFAYVFRTYVTDTLGNQSNTPPRCYVTVGETGGTPDPEPEPDDNAAPTAAFTVTPQGTTGLSFAFDGAGSSDPDGDPLTYAWDFGDDETATGETVAHTYAEADTYEVTLTVTDPDGASDSVSEEVEAGDEETPDEDAPVIASFLVNGEDAVTVAEGDTVTLEWELAGGAATDVFLAEGVDVDPQDVTDEGGDLDVTVDATTTYTLIATNDEGGDTASVTVTVN